MGAPTGVAPCVEHTPDVTFSSQLTSLQYACRLQRSCSAVVEHSPTAEQPHCQYSGVQVQV